MKLPKLLSPLALLLPFASCHKTGMVEGPVSVNIVNAIADGKPFVPVFGGSLTTEFASAQTVAYSAAQLYTPYSGPNALYIAPTPDSSKRIFSGALELSANKMYSFFLAGDTTRPDTLFVQDDIPYYSDSAAGVRIVNLSPDSKPIKVNIKGNTPAQTEFSDLGYRQISSFKKYAATAGVSGSQYIFEVRYQATDSLLLTYAWTYDRYKNNTLVMSGSATKGSTTPLEIFSVKNY